MAKILIVDDRPLNRQFLLTLLGYGGHQLFEAADGAEALVKIRKERPDLVITDLLMPTMDGFQLVTQMRAEPEIAATEAIFYTATYRLQEADQLAQACGVSIVIPKPSDPQHIVEAVNAALGKTLPPARGAAAPVPAGQEIAGSNLKRKLNDYVLDLTLLSTQMTELVNQGGEIARAESAAVENSEKLRQALADLQSVSLKLASLLELGLDLTSRQDPDVLLNIFCRAAVKLIGARYGALGIVTDDGRTFVHFKCHAEGKDDVSGMMPDSPRAGVLAALLDEPRSRRMTNPGGDPTVLGLAPSHPPVHGFLGVPILSSEEVYGWFYLVDRLDEKEFAESDEQLAATLAAQLAVVYQTVRLYDEVQRHAARLELEVHRRKQAEDKFYSAIQAAPNGMLVVDGDGLITLLNAKIVELFGYSADELIGQRVEILLPDSLRAKHAGLRRQYMASAQTRDLYGRRKDGSEFPVEVGLSPLGAGQGPMILASVIDISERKKAEDRLRLQSAALRAAANGILITNREGTIAWVNSAFSGLTGYSAEEAVGKTPRLLKSGMHDPRFYDDLWRTILRGETWSGELINRRKDGTFYPEHQCITPVCNPAGEISHFIAIKQDITERKKAESAAAERLRCAEFAAELGGALAAEDKLQPMLQNCAQAMVQHLDAAFARIWTLHSNENVLVLQASAGMYTHIDGGHSRISVGQFKIGLIADERRPHLTNHVVGDPRVSDQAWARREGMVAFAGYPLLVDGRLLGVIAMFSRREVSPAVFDALGSAAKEIAVGIKRKLAEDHARQHFERIRILHEIDRAITSTLDLPAVITVILDNVTRFFPQAASVGIALRQRGSERMEPVACRGMALEEWKRAMFDNDSFLVTAGLKDPLTISELGSDPRLGSVEREFIDKYKYRSLLVVPIKINDQLMGSVGFATTVRHNFSQDEITFLSTLAGQVAVAIQNAELYGEVQRQAAELAEREQVQRMLKELSLDITTMSIDRLLEKLAAIVRQVFKVDVCDLRFLGKERWQKVLICCDGLVEWLAEGGEFGAGANLWVVNQRKSIAIRDYPEEKKFTTGRVVKRFGIRGFLAAPLIGRNGDVVGVIRALAKEPREFKQSEIDLFEQMAAGAAIALENSRLYSDLQISNQVKSDFLGVMSHELRTPLNIITGFARLLKEDLCVRGDATSQVAVKKIETQTQVLLNMIETIMEARQIESGDTGVIQQHFDLETLFADLKARFEAPKDKAIDLIWNVGSDPTELTSDYEKVKQILANLIDNAVKFTERGTVTISATLDGRNGQKAETQEAGLAELQPGAGRFVKFQVSDTGIGIPADMLPVVYIAKKYAEALGAELTVESAEGHGSTFQLVLPCCK